MWVSQQVFSDVGKTVCRGSLAEDQDSGIPVRRPLLKWNSPVCGTIWSGRRLVVAAARKPWIANNRQSLDGVADVSLPVFYDELSEGE